MRLPGFDSEAGGGQAAVDQVGPVLDLLQLAHDEADQAVQIGGGEVGYGPLVSDQMPSVGLPQRTYASYGEFPITATPPR